MTVVVEPAFVIHLLRVEYLDCLEMHFSRHTSALVD
jgi:hypothetical protein